jgi:two-component system CheB/CheR fusion protein
MDSKHAALPLRIFVVENHKDTLHWLTCYLEMLGYSVESARTRREALEALPKSDCDVLISDIGLPDGDGWDLLKATNRSRKVYGIAISGFGSTADRARSLAAGYRHHILKPFDPDLLESILADVAREAGHTAAA